MEETSGSVLVFRFLRQPKEERPCGPFYFCTCEINLLYETLSFSFLPTDADLPTVIKIKAVCAHTYAKYQYDAAHTMNILRRNAHDQL